MKISIITINYNNATGLEQTINSVINQTYQDIEYIIIDGGSVDGSQDILKSKEDGFAYWISEHDNGIYDAMNKGIMEATGEYLLFLNSGDVLISKNIIQLCFDKIKKNIVDIAYGNLIVVDSSGEEKLKKYPIDLSFEYFTYDTLPHPAAFIRKNLFSNYGIYDTSLRIVSDWKFFLTAIFKYNCSYAYLDIAITKFKTDGLSSLKKSAPIIANEKSIVFKAEFPHFIKLISELKELKSIYNGITNSRKIKFLEKLGIIPKVKRI